MWTRVFGAVALLSSMVVLPATAAETLTLDTEKSKINFLGKKSDGQHAGGFKSFTVEAEADFDEPTNGKLVIEIATASLWSDNAKLTNHLKNPDFFDIRKYPKIVFTATEIDPQSETEAKIIGDLKMLDKTASLAVPCRVTVTDDVVELVAKFKLDRTVWGMDYGTGNIENDVEIDAKFVLKR